MNTPNVGRTRKAKAVKSADPKITTINAEQELYVIPAGDGYSCLGFDVVLNRSAKLVTFLKREQYQLPVRGSLEAYSHYLDLLNDARAYCETMGVRCPIELTPQLIGLEGRQVEVVDAYDETRRFVVGKSTGWMPCHLEISNSRSDGGPAVMGTPFKSVTVIR